MGLARNELPEPTEQRLRLLWVSSQPHSPVWSLLQCQKGKNLPKAGTIKLHRFSAEITLGETARGAGIVTEYSAEGSEAGGEV